SGELEADAIIQTTLSTKGSNKVLHVKLYVHNKKLKGFKVEFANVKSPKFKQMLHDKMLEKLGLEASASDDKPAKKKKAAAADDDRRRRRERRRSPAPRRQARRRRGR